MKPRVRRQPMAFSLKRPQSRPSARALGYAALWGALTAMGVWLVLMLCRHYGIEAGNPLSWWSYSIFLIGLVGAPLHYRHSLTKEDDFNIRQAYLLCVCQALCMVVALVLILALYVSWIDPEYLALFKQQQALYWEAHPNLTEAERVQRLQWVSDIKLSHLLWNVAGEMTMMGVLVGLLVAVMVKKQNRKQK